MKDFNENISAGFRVIPKSDKNARVVLAIVGASYDFRGRLRLSGVKTDGGVGEEFFRG